MISLCRPNLLALPIRKFLECFPGQPAHAGLQVGDGDPFGVFQIIQRVEDLFSGVASNGGSSRNLDRESCLCLHFSPLCRGHSTLGGVDREFDLNDLDLQAFFANDFCSRKMGRWPARGEERQPGGPVDMDHYLVYSAD
jgi:hypothetical protein